MIGRDWSCTHSDDNETPIVLIETMSHGGSRANETNLSEPPESPTALSEPSPTRTCFARHVSGRHTGLTRLAARHALPAPVTASTAARTGLPSAFCRCHRHQPAAEDRSAERKGAAVICACRSWAGGHSAPAACRQMILPAPAPSPGAGPSGDAAEPFPGRRPADESPLLPRPARPASEAGSQAESGHRRSHRQTHRRLPGGNPSKAELLTEM